MWPFRRRRPTGSEKDVALAEARRATARVRGEKARLERYRAGKQSEPATTMTTNQWLGSGGT